MARIAGIDLPRNKKVEFALSYIYGIGHTVSKKILKSSGVNPDTRVHELTEEQSLSIRNAIADMISVEGELRGQKSRNIKRLMDIARKREFQNKNQEIDALLQAFRLPLLRSLIKELSKLKKNDQAEPDDSSLFEVLSQIYNNYELHSAVKKAENEIGTPKILYSRFLGKSDD